MNGRIFIGIVSTAEYHSKISNLQNCSENDLTVLLDVNVWNCTISVAEFPR
jgi:hypothetical protein